MEVCHFKFQNITCKCKLVTCDNIQTTLGKTFMSKCDVHSITHLPHICLFGNFSIIFGVVPGIHFVVMMVSTLCIDLSQ